MNKELIHKLIAHARAASDNAYCPNSNVPEGCALLVEGNLIFGGCNVEFATETLEAGKVAMAKAISDSKNNFHAICFFSEKDMLYPTGGLLQLLSEFNPAIQIVVANNETYAFHNLHELLPFRRVITEGE